MVRMISAALVLASLSCSSRSGAPDASVAVSPPAPVPPVAAPSNAGRPTDAPPPNQFRRPVFDKAAMDQAIRSYERAHGQVQPAPAQP